eukprot:scaffold3443_cov404-Prasinococcus_capsulatus_cf.AAC.6
MALFQLRRFDEARQAYARGLELDDMDPSCNEGLGLLKSKMAEIARREVRRARAAECVQRRACRTTAVARLT